MLTSAASAALTSVKPRADELGTPRVRAGTVVVPANQRSGRVRVIAVLPDEPLAAARGRSFSLGGAAPRLDLRSPASTAYAARLEQAQRQAVAQLHAAVPAARVQHRYTTVLNGLALSVPARDLPAVRRLGFVRRVYPSLQYTLRLNRSPGVIGAAAFAAATGARGEGMKIAVVDDGVDSAHRFFNPAGFQYPVGYPRGGIKWTTPKVIVARAYPGPGSGRPGRMPIDRRQSFHATHVAGIAAGVAGTVAPAGADHRLTPDLSGVAPRAWIGNYRVFNAPSPIGNVANTPEIVAAFEDAVKDGMDVINFSGGGPQTDPINDAMIETIENVVSAGVVPVISAGNDRDDFGTGTAGSPGTAPDAISVAAVSNTHVFTPVLSVSASGAPAALRRLPFLPAGGRSTPASWLTADQTLVDVGTLLDRQGRPVDRKLCGTGRDPSGPGSPLAGRPLAGAVALVWRGTCTFVSKAQRARAAGAVGIVVVDNRSGEANGIPITLGVPGGMVSDLDGVAPAQLPGRAPADALPIRVSRAPEEVVTGRSGVVTSFSSVGPTAYGHQLKPDLSAPGGSILSATLGAFGGPFASFDGTSMAAPHVAGLAALLLERHPGWSPRQVKSALVSTAGPAWADTARTVEAPVLLGGGGLVSVAAADTPLVFSDPASLSFGDLKPLAGPVRTARLLSVGDLGGGGGTWTVELRPQSATAGASLELPPLVTVPPGGTTEFSVAARAAAGAPSGDNYGFVVLRQGSVTRRIPYAFFVSQPQLVLHGEPRDIRTVQTGTTQFGASRAGVYRFPGWPFRPPPDYTGPPMDEAGAERVYRFRVAEPAVNIGAAVIDVASGAVVDPWFLGSLDENDVQGYAGTPVNVNSYTYGYQLDVGAAGSVYPRPKTYYVAVDSPRDPVTGRMLGGRYVLRSWIDDVFPPAVGLASTRVGSGRPTIVVRTDDFALSPRGISGVDPTSLLLAYRRVLVGVSAYDPVSGLAVFILPREAPAIPPGRTEATLVAADFQESKNLATPGGSILPNTTFRDVVIRGVRGPAATWLFPERRACVGRTAQLAVAASASRGVAAVTFRDGNGRIATVRRGNAGLYSVAWRTTGERRGRHVLRAEVRERGGRTFTAERVVRICR